MTSISQGLIKRQKYHIIEEGKFNRKNELWQGIEVMEGWLVKSKKTFKEQRKNKY